MICRNAGDSDVSDTEEHQREMRGLAYAKELEGHVAWLDTFTAAALGVLAVASGIYTYLGVSSLLDDNGALSFFAAISYSIAVSVGIFVFWSYLLRLLPAVRTAGARMGLMVSMLIGSGAIIAMSSWLNAAALAGAAAVEQHLATTVQEYQGALERTHEITLSAQSLERDVARVRQSFEDLSEQEAAGSLSGLAGRGAVFRVLRQKSDELAGLEAQIASQQPLVDAAFAEGNLILSRMRALTVEPGPIEARSVLFSEEAVRLAGVIAQMRLGRAAGTGRAHGGEPRGTGIDHCLGAGCAGPAGGYAAGGCRYGDCHAARARYGLYAHQHRRCGDPLCRKFCAVLGRGDCH